MTAIKAADVERFIARPDPGQPIVLIYGPDAGLVRERVDALVRASVDNPDDPFSLARIESEELSANPGRLADEANTVPLFGGRRAVLLRMNSRHNILSSIEVLLETPPRDCRVIIEAGDLRKNAPLRVLCEKAKAAAAVPCYVDNEAALGRLIDDEMRAAGLDDCAGRARGPARPDRRRPARLAQRGAQARALRARQSACRARRCHGGGVGCLRHGARRRARRRLRGQDRKMSRPNSPRCAPAALRRRRSSRRRSVISPTCTRCGLPSTAATSSKPRCGAARRRCISRARSWSAKRCAPGRRRVSSAPCSSWRKLRSTPAATRRSPRRSRSARCCRSR